MSYLSGLLRDADRRGTILPQNWTILAANQIEDTERSLHDAYVEIECLAKKDAESIDLIKSLLEEIKILQSLVPHPGGGSCERCGCSPSTTVHICSECKDRVGIK